MEHTFALIKNVATSTRVTFFVEGAINGTRYRIDDVGAHIDDNGEVVLGYHPSWINSTVRDLRRELEPLRPDLTEADYRSAAEEIYDETQQHADDYFRETSRRYTPN